MITPRGATVFSFAAALALAGALYGVEEFVLVAASSVVAFVLGAAVLARRAGLARRSVRLEVRMPGQQLEVGRHASGAIVIRNVGLRSMPAVFLESPANHWVLSHPGLRARRDPGQVQPLEAQRDGRAPRRRRVGLRTFTRFAKLALLADPVPIRAVAKGAGETFDLPVPTASRGLLTLSPVAIWCEDPLRLLAKKVGSTPPAHVLVCPRPRREHTFLRSTADTYEARATDAGDIDRAKSTREGSEFRTIRPYVPGDRMTRLHWPVFARSGELAVRDFAEPRSGRISLLVDLRRGDLDDGALEAVVSLAAGIGIQALSDGDLVELCTSGGDRLEITPGPDARNGLLRALAVVGPADDEGRARSSGAHGSRRAGAVPHARATGDLVVVTCAPDGPEGVPGAVAASARTLVAR